MGDTLFLRKGESITIVNAENAEPASVNLLLEFLNNNWYWIMIVVWILFTLMYFWLILKKSKLGLIDQGRALVYYILITVFLLFVIVGPQFDFLDEYLSGIITEIFGIGFTVLILDAITSKLRKKEDSSYRRLAWASLRRPIFTYCYTWLTIYWNNSRTSSATKKVEEFSDLKAFLESPEFLNQVQSYDFNKMMSQSKTWGEYHNQTINKVADRFQDTISKYSHKLPVEDLKLLEHFGGGSRFFAIFAVIQTMSGMIVTTTEHGVPIYENRPIINPFAKVSQDNLKKHFQQLLMLVDTYNQSAETDYEKWDLKALTSLDKIEELNGKTDVKW
jgi:hypothetical protein